MTRRIDPDPIPPVEIRISYPGAKYKDLKAVAKLSGLAVSQYIRALTLHQVDKAIVDEEKS